MLGLAKEYAKLETNIPITLYDQLYEVFSCTSFRIFLLVNLGTMSSTRFEFTSGYSSCVFRYRECFPTQNSGQKITADSF